MILQDGLYVLSRRIHFRILVIFLSPWKKLHPTFREEPSYLFQDLKLLILMRYLLASSMGREFRTGLETDWKGD